jgi:hypothetical protein
MPEGTRSKLSMAGAAVGAVLAGNMLWYLLAPGIPALHPSRPKATITSQAVFTKQTAAQSVP